MPIRPVVVLVANVLLGLVGLVTAELPYTPTQILVSRSDNNITAWIFSPESSTTQTKLSRLDLSGQLNTSISSALVVSETLPFLNSTTARGYTPAIHDDGTITVLAGDCTQGTGGSQTWQFVLDNDKRNGSWTESKMAIDSGMNQEDTTSGSNFLAASLVFPPNADTIDSTVYIFGGMCPSSNSSDSDWMSAASYSSEMLVLSPVTASTKATNHADSFHLSESGARFGPIAEAGLTITPLTPTYSNSSGSSEIQGQNFVLLGGHTSGAFINMSQVALLSLPVGTWSFISVDQPSGSTQTELAVRSDNDAIVEPRSGHSALLTPDGNRIILFGGWVGDIDTPATPQLAILELGDGFGGSGDWSWKIPSSKSAPFSDTEGIYGHGATMLPGGIMMIMGGYSISTSSSARLKVRDGSSSTPSTNSKMYLFNTTSNEWISSYTNPSMSTSTSSSSDGSSGALSSSSQKAGLGVGVSLGCSTLVGLIAVYIWYSRRLRRRRELREKQLHDLALGAALYHSDIIPEGFDGRGGNPEMQYIGGLKRKPVPPSSNAYPWAPMLNPSQSSRMSSDDFSRGDRAAERTGLLVEIPSPTRGLRRSLHGRQPPSSNFGATGRGMIHTIDERGEYEDSNSSRRVSSEALAHHPNRMSDPFKDQAPPLNPTPALIRSPSDEKKQRMAEIQGWVDDWSAAASKMELSRNASSTSRSITNSQSQSQSQSNSGSGRESPNKSDRTGSNLSEASMMSSGSLQRSNIGTIRRDSSNRGASAGYAQTVFAGAAAAVNRMYVAATGQDPVDAPVSGTSASSGLDMQAHKAPPLLTDMPRMLPPVAGAAVMAESEGLLHTYNKNIANNVRPEDEFATPPESPVKERPAHSNPSSYTYSSLLPTTTSTDFEPPDTSRRGPLGFLGSVKRAFTGTSAMPPTSYQTSGGGTVKRKILEYESRSASSSPTKQYYHSTRTSPVKELIEDNDGSPRRSASAAAAFWRGRKGRKDWAEAHEAEDQNDHHQVFEARPSQEEDGEWDIEQAVQNRVVQVMFTVPKERLRVVNVDADRLSISDVDFEGGENVDGLDVRDRMEPRTGDTITTLSEDHDHEYEGKGKQKA